MRRDPLEEMVEQALVDALPDGLVLAVEDGIARGCTVAGVLEILDRQQAGPLLRRGCEIVATRAVAGALQRQRNRDSHIG